MTSPAAGLRTRCGAQPAIGPNLLLWGWVATLICRRIARDGGTDLSAGRFTAFGSLLLPLQLAIAFAGLHLTGAL